MVHSRPLCLFSFYSNKFYAITTVDFSRIRTRIVGAEDQNADHLTTATALMQLKVSLTLLMTGFKLRTSGVGTN